MSEDSYKWCPHFLNVQISLDYMLGGVRKPTSMRAYFKRFHKSLRGANVTYLKPLRLPLLRSSSTDAQCPHLAGRNISHGKPSFKNKSPCFHAKFLVYETKTSGNKWVHQKCIWPVVNTGINRLPSMTAYRRWSVESKPCNICRINRVLCQRLRREMKVWQRCIYQNVAQLFGITVTDGFWLYIAGGVVDGQQKLRWLSRTRWAMPRWKQK